MDNVSKALIMSGAILLAIAMVGFGMYMYSSSSSLGDVASTYMDSTQAHLANSELRQYAGPKKEGSKVKDLLEYIDVLNVNNRFPVKIEIASSKFDPSGTGAIIKNKSEVRDNGLYSLIWADANNDGYYDKLQITSVGVYGTSGDISGDIIDLTGDESGDVASGDVSGDVISGNTTSGDAVSSGDITPVTSGDENTVLPESGEVIENIVAE